MSIRKPVPVVAVLSVLLLTACAGKGVTYEAIEAPVQDSCVVCHDSKGMDKLVADINALDDALFTEAAFPDANFPTGLRSKTVEALIAAAAVPGDESLDSKMAQRKAWILHELHELKSLLEEAVPPDYTSQKAFDDFAAFGESGAYEGCEIGDKLDLGFQGDPEGMIPLWTETLFELLKRDITPISNDDRQKIKDYVDGLLPGGLKACQPGEDSAS